MSGLAGIFKFDPRERVSASGLLELDRAISRIGPDGGARHLNFNVGMAYRAFHTTPESRSEKQPFVHEGKILTWDGRLDNRDEIRSQVGLSCEIGIPADVDVVFAAYRHWGTAAFAELVGDWAIALWDEVKQQLILARDYMGVRRLFYRFDDDGVTWCTLPEPLVLTARRDLHLDLDYLAGCFYPRPPIEATAYQEIRGVVPGSFTTFCVGGAHKIERFWSLNPLSCVHYSSDSEYEDHFLHLLRHAVRRRLRSTTVITAELSGGIDSSSIVCIADEIRKREIGPSVETLSYYDPDEPSGDERPYFAVVERVRGRSGTHISLRDFAHQTSGLTLQPLPEEYCVATPGYFAKHLEWQILIQRLLERKGSRVLLSGLGGDEFLGGVQYEATELAEYLTSGDITSFCRSLVSWSVARRKTIYSLLRDVFILLKSHFMPSTMLNDSVAFIPWVRLTPGRHRFLNHFTEWHALSPTKVTMELVRYSLATQLSCTDPPLTGCVERRYPYLDRELFTFLASIPRQQIMQPRRRRHLMRSALQAIVPEEVLFRKTKWFGSRMAQRGLLDDRATVSQMFSEPWLSAEQMVDVDEVRKEFDAVQHGVSQNGILLRSAIGLEQWLRSQARLMSLSISQREDYCAAVSTSTKSSDELLTQ